MIQNYSLDPQNIYIKQALTDILNTKPIQKVFSIVCDLKYNTKNSIIQINDPSNVLHEISDKIISENSIRQLFNSGIVKLLIHFFYLCDTTGNILLYRKSMNEAFYSKKERDQLFLKINQQLQLEMNPIERYNQPD